MGRRVRLSGNGSISQRLEVIQHAMFSIGADISTFIRRVIINTHVMCTQFLGAKMVVISVLIKEYAVHVHVHVCLVCGGFGVLG